MALKITMLLTYISNMAMKRTRRVTYCVISVISIFGLFFYGFGVNMEIDISTQRFNDSICSKLTASSASNNVSNIFLHVGPAKTGTTSFQDYFACHSSFLKEYNVSFLGKVNPRDVRNCKGVPQDFVRKFVFYKSSKAMKKLQKVLEARISLGQHDILSNEDFKKVLDLINTLFRTMNDTLEYNIIPVITYRRYHDWIKSLYHYSNKPHWYDKDWSSWDRQLDIPTFQQFLIEQQKNKHPSVELVHTFQTLVPRTRKGGTTPCVQVLNLHSDDPITKFASIVTGGTNVSLVPPITRVSNVDKDEPFTIDSEILALKLKSAGLVHESFSRREVVKMLQQKMKSLYGNISSSNAPPLSCLSQTKKQDFWRKTVQSEEYLLSMGLIAEFPQGQETLLQEFQKSIETKVYCNVLIEEMIQEESWAIFLPSLIRTAIYNPQFITFD